MDETDLRGGESVETGLPDDVSRLYQWAGLRGVGYRDFSAERRSVRAGLGSAEREELRRRTAERWSAPFESVPAPDATPGAIDDPYEGDRHNAVDSAADLPYTSDGERDAAAEVIHEGISAPAEVREAAKAAPSPAERAELRLAAPVLAVFSLAGGTGKTSLVAALGRALSSLGEEVQLVETAADGLLPYHFGTSEVRPGLLRTFSPPPKSAHAAVHLLSCDHDQDADQNATVRSIAEPAATAQRVLVDLNGQSGWLLRRLAELAARATDLAVLVPVTPDLSSVLRLRSMEKYLHGLAAADGEWILPYYVLNRFDEGSSLHREMREALAGQLGERLLPFGIRQDAAVGEALGQRMTVIDYPQGKNVAGDYVQVARWIWESVPGRVGLRGQP